VLGVEVAVRWAPGLVVSALSSAGILPEAPQSVISAAFDERPRSLPWPQLAAGLLLIFARRPLSRLLAYGPLLHGNGGVGHGLTSD